ncbi:M20 family metallopeptidase [Streptomyces sp. NPDC008343]|uniref:M20 family metallopeptidase n=1 Tax=Streptomyces sp. NPDC008343 TaxID=3364828 RepID=UPI0036EDC842
MTHDRFRAVLPAMLRDLGELVSVESPSHDTAALARSAAVVAAQGSRLLRAEPELLVVEGRTHLRWKFGSGPSRVLLVGHHDTVHPLGTLERSPWTVSGGIARGPGCFDMKAGLTLIFHALAALDDLDGVAVLVSADEELGSPTAKGLIEETARGCSAAFVTEPSADGALKTTRKGISQYEVAIQGRAAHAGLEPERGVNATVELAHQVLAIAALNAPAVGTSVTPTVVAAGDTVNTVPGAATIAVDVRALTVAEQQRVDKALHSLTCLLPGADMQIRRPVHAPPLEAASSEGLFGLAERVAADLGLPRPRGATVGGGSDGNLIAALGVPTLDGLGAVGGGAHTAAEHVVVDDLPRSAALLAGLVTATV